MSKLISDDLRQELQVHVRAINKTLREIEKKNGHINICAKIEPNRMQNGDWSRIQLKITIEESIG